MALGPVSNLPAAPPAPSPGRGVTDAQRAFFQAALGQPMPVTAVEAIAPQPLSVPEPPKAAAATPADAPRTGYRPGSLLDIRI